MGWWSADVMGGDTPLDLLWHVEAELGVKDLYPLRSVEPSVLATVCTALEAGGFDRVIATFEREGIGGDLAIGLEVLAAVAMAAGATISPETMERFVWATNNDPYADDWDERADEMTKLRATLGAYDPANPTVLETVGLFDKLAGLGS